MPLPTVRVSKYLVPEDLTPEHLAEKQAADADKQKACAEKIDTDHDAKRPGKPAGRIA